jgi:hypothetical protein
MVAGFRGSWTEYSRRSRYTGPQSARNADITYVIAAVGFG